MRRYYRQTGVPLRFWRFRLSTLFGIVTAALLFWQRHNERVIKEMGMDWDTGAPMWPYETPWIVFEIINAPAVLAGRAVGKAFGLHAWDHLIPVHLTAAILLWFGVGAWIDRGILRRYVHQNSCAVGAAVVAGLAFSCAGLLTISDAVQWWRSYGAWSTESVLRLLRLTWVVPWCALIVAMAARAILNRAPHSRH
jgi:hypothetical protein